MDRIGTPGFYFQFFRHTVTFFRQKNFSPRGPPFNVLEFCKRMDAEKYQRVPLFSFFGIVRLFLGDNFFTKGSPFNFCDELRQNDEKSQSIPPLVSSGIVCYTGKKGKPFFDSVLWANWYISNFCRTFGRTILVTSSVSKKKFQKKSHKAGITSEL